MNTLQKIGLAIVALPTLVGTAFGGVTGNLEGLKSLEKDGTDLIRPNLFYDGPAESDVYSFHELNEDGSHYGRTTVSRQIAGDLGGRIEFDYGSGMPTIEALGLQYKIIADDRGFLQVWATKWNGEDNGKTLLGYFVEKEIGPVKLSSFNEINVQGGISQDYGEIKAEVPLGESGYSIGINDMMLQGDDGGMDIEHNLRAVVTRNF